MHRWQVQRVLAPSMLGQDLPRWKRIQPHDERTYSMHHMVYNIRANGLDVTLPIQEVKIAISERLAVSN
jgi:hypothetical protein